VCDGGGVFFICKYIKIIILFFILNLFLILLN
jgi:hypothetical protein